MIRFESIDAFGNVLKGNPKSNQQLLFAMALEDMESTNSTSSCSNYDKTLANYSTNSCSKKNENVLPQPQDFHNTEEILGNTLANETKDNKLSYFQLVRIG